jgi:hypothetical protein
MNRRLLAPIAVVVLLAFTLGPVVPIFLGFALFYNVPLILVVWLARERLGTTVARLLIAIGFGIAVGYKLWQVEWFDVWRHGTPPASYLATVYVPYVLGGVFAGWVFASLITPPPEVDPA